MENIDIIDRLPYELANCLTTNAFFRDIVIVVVEQGALASEVARAQGITKGASGKIGVMVLVLQIVADDMSNNLQFGPMTLKPAFQVIENVELNKGANGTKKSARKVARKIRDVIKNQNIIGLIGNMCTGSPCIEPLEIKDLGDGIISYQVNFQCEELGLVQMSVVQMPSISVAAPTQSTPAQFILATPTPGAVIWYTLDDKFPFNGDKTVYPQSTAQQFIVGTPVNIPAGGCWLRARAYLDGATNISSGIQRAWLAN